MVLISNTIPRVDTSIPNHEQTFGIILVPMDRINGMMSHQNACRHIPATSPPLPMIEHLLMTKNSNRTMIRQKQKHQLFLHDDEAGMEHGRTKISFCEFCAVTNIQDVKSHDETIHQRNPVYSKSILSRIDKKN